ncbi:hypothetical protein WJX84_000403 [Apatococcus fuscideae]|uniref:Uncharacterized protein n=1 Tax=Apatococcus fuscideae TaxID=2026836 RepID=A0AAW1TLB0_9CHLO
MQGAFQQSIQGAATAWKTLSLCPKSRSCQGSHPSEQQRKEANQLPEQAHSQRKGSPSLLEMFMGLFSARSRSMFKP